MRVLWFINIPTVEAASLLGYEKLNIGGWIDSLRGELISAPDISLGIAFSWGDNIFKKFQHNNVQYYKIPDLRPRKGFRKRIGLLTHQLEPLEVLNYCLRAVDDFKPDIINIFGTERNYGLIIDKTTIPCVIHIQGILEQCVNKYFIGISRGEILCYGDKHKLLRGAGLLHSYYNMKKQSARELEIFRICKYFMGRTKWDRELISIRSPLAKYYHCDEILRNEFYQAKWHIMNNNKKIIWSTLSNNNYKGLEMLAEAGLILKNIKPCNFEFRVGGISNHDETYQIVQNKYGSNALNFLKPLGSMNANMIVGHLLCSDIYVHPSHIDNSPNSLCEAMILGLPVISTDVGGISSLITNEEDGMLVKDAEPHALSRAILKLFNEQELADKLSHNARLRATQRHNKNIIIRNLINTYNQIVKSVS